MRRVDLAEIGGAALVIGAAGLLLIVIGTAGNWFSSRQPASLECVTEEHYFPATNTNWVRLTCNDGSIHWEMR